MGRTFESLRSKPRHFSENILNNDSTRTEHQHHYDPSSITETAMKQHNWLRACNTYTQKKHPNNSSHSSCWDKNKKMDLTATLNFFNYVIVVATATWRAGLQYETTSREAYWASRMRGRSTVHAMTSRRQRVGAPAAFQLFAPLFEIAWLQRSNNFT
jgi:hypothetical protein